jgi:DNA-binding NarL/FixJ family response regulator
VSELEPDVGIIDISMPIMNGILAAAEIRKRGSTMKLVFLTVNEDRDFVQAAFESGASGYVVKRQMAIRPIGRS